MLSIIEKINRRAKKIANRKDLKIVPGQAVRMSDAAAIGDGIRQGDLYLKIVAAVPSDYKLTEKPTLQLVPGTTEGARHCLDSLKGVKVFLPADFGDADSLAGPCLVLAEERTVEHPVHGNVTLPAGVTVLCGYQREYDAELRRGRRNAD